MCRLVLLGVCTGLRSEKQMVYASCPEPLGKSTFKYFQYTPPGPRGLSGRRKLSKKRGGGAAALAPKICCLELPTSNFQLPTSNSPPPPKSAQSQPPRPCANPPLEMKRCRRRREAALVGRGTTVPLSYACAHLVGILAASQGSGRGAKPTLAFAVRAEPWRGDVWQRPPQCGCKWGSHVDVMQPKMWPSLGLGWSWAYCADSGPSRALLAGVSGTYHGFRGYTKALTREEQAAHDIRFFRGISEHSQIQVPDPLLFGTIIVGHRY